MSGNDAPKVTFFESPVSGWAQVPYNTREVLTESGEWTSPITGYVKATCIGGGQAGASRNNLANAEATITPGGDTIFGNCKARGGATIIGGAAGEVLVFYIRVESGEIIPYTVASGGSSDVNYIITEEDLVKKCQNYPASYGLIYTAGGNTFTYLTHGTGGSNGTPYGGGGGGGAVCGSSTALAMAAQGSGNGFPGEVKVRTYASGGNGGPGAIILEYANPKKKD